MARRQGQLAEVGKGTNALVAFHGMALQDMSTALDWREIFKKSVKLVEWAEGVHFLYPEAFSPDEWTAIEAALNEVHAECSP
jgi:hypothetical protein